ncbi:MAG TPA: hypothetical protein PLC15_03200 [Candidatus Obscuribacter sp.]|nr:hypothetical protein [Candidatus Obscuribacter sp.]MBL8084075.1 hypothetical protein [Candidatus Obscuribacter sp.]HNB14356.1 hypothetical protein [Candidatus Obscuribacter sp.]HND66440.1 hypothetical protein [Candidatus Obscuribacter sp.]HNG17808.1 hypothetical protein [Candidatus Obscuribacter sp.]
MADGFDGGHGGGGSAGGFGVSDADVGHGGFGVSDADVGGQGFGTSDADIGDNGPGVSDLDVGHGHGSADGCKNCPESERVARVTQETLMKGHSHCDPNGWNGSFRHVSVDVNSGSINDGVPVATYGGAGNGSAEAERKFREKVRQALTDPNRRYYGAHVVGHGPLEVPELFSRIASSEGLVRICNQIGNFSPVNEYKHHITDWTGAISLAPTEAALLSPKEQERRKGCRVPAGYYDGANGFTRIWRQYWQVGKRKSMVPWDGSVKLDREQRTYLEVSIITWYYGEALDYETRLDIRIVSLPVYRWFIGTKIGAWYWREIPWRKHQKACDKVLAQLFDALKKSTPSELARQRRCEILDRAKKQEPEKPKLPPTTPLPVPAEEPEKGLPPASGGKTDGKEPKPRLPETPDSSGLPPETPPPKSPFPGDAELISFAPGHSGADLDSLFLSAADKDEPAGQGASTEASTGEAAAASEAADGTVDKVVLTTGEAAAVSTEVPAAEAAAASQPDPNRKVKVEVDLAGLLKGK